MPTGQYLTLLCTRERRVHHAYRSVSHSCLPVSGGYIMPTGQYLTPVYPLSGGYIMPTGQYLTLLYTHEWRVHHAYRSVSHTPVYP